MEEEDIDYYMVVFDDTYDLVRRDEDTLEEAYETICQWVFEHGWKLSEISVYAMSNIPFMEDQDFLNRMTTHKQAKMAKELEIAKQRERENKKRRLEKYLELRKEFGEE